MSKKVKQIALTLILTCTIILTLVSTAKAVYASLDQIKGMGAGAIGYTTTIAQNDLENRIDLYCVNHQRYLWNNTYVPATVQTYVKIIGNQIYDSNGNLVEGLTEEQKKENAKLAYLVYLGRNVGYGTYASGTGYSQAQRGIYANFNTWLASVGSRWLDYNSWYDAANENIGPSAQTVATMNEYVNSLGSGDVGGESAQATDNTVKENISVEMSYRTVDGQEKVYYNIGPFNWTFNGTLQDFTVTDKDNNPIDSSRISVSQYVGTSQNFITPESIESGKDFYISIDSESNIEGIRSVSATAKINDAQQVYAAELWFLYARPYQNVMLATPSVETITSEAKVSTDITIDFAGNLKLIKLDQATAKRLPNVQFRFKYRDQYYTTSGGWSTDANASNITFTTDGNGEITLTNIPIGNWTIEEVANNNPGYESAALITNTVTVRCYQFASRREITREVIYGIFKSEEGKSKLSSLDNTEFVRVAYRAILGREADPSGLSGNVAILNGGRTEANENQVLANLYNSDEFKNSYQDTDTWRNSFITRLYEAVLGRTPNANREVAGWRWVLKGYTPYTLDNEKETGELNIKKVDKDTLEALKNVGFKFQFKETGKYVLENANGSISYVDNIDDATEFLTDTYGNLHVRGLLIGTYKVYETKKYNKFYGDIEAEISTEDTTGQPTEIPNEYQAGDLKIEKVDEDNPQIKLKDVEFTIRATSGKEQGKYVYSNNGEAAYSTQEVRVKTNDLGIIEIKNVWIGSYQVTEVNNPHYGYDVSTTSPKLIQIEKRDNSTEVISNAKQLGNLKIEKVDEDNPEIKLEDVEFTIRATTGHEAGKYVYPNSEGQAQYSTQEVRVKTDDLGLIEINDLWIGTYEVTEVNNPHYGYETTSSSEITVVEKNKDTEKVITNKLLYVKLSGYVFEDIQAEKQSVRNGLYRDDIYDVNDVLVQGVTVRLKEGNTVVKETTTDANGAYTFEDILIDKLSSYYIEFEYDGLIYSNTIPHLDKDNGGKASEGTLRDTFNNRFATVENGGANNRVAVKDSNGNTVYNVDYTLNPDQASATIGNTSQCTITSTTANAGYVLNYERGTGAEPHIRNINLGIYKRTQADLAIMQDLDQVKVEIAGYGHIYRYANRFEHLEGDEMDYTQDAWNVGVRYKNPYNQLIYTRPIYNSDANYEDENEENELKVALTYKIAIRNEETITGKVNQVVDYFDRRYEIAGIGTGIDENTGNITNPLNYVEDTSYSNSTYKKVIINTDILVQASTSNSDETAKRETAKYIYIQFNLSRENVLNLLNEAKINNNDVSRLPNLENIAEITSYTSYSDTQGTTLYAALDKDSVPQNTTPGTTTTYEDDTDTAPTIAITIANARQVSGTIFEDNADEASLSEKNIRQGNGTLDEGENAVGGVKVQLVEVDDAGNATNNVAKVFDEQANNGNGAWTDAECTAETTQDGNYTITGYIPGRYAIKYIWGDGTYKIVDGTQEQYTDMVENYKATNLSQATYESEASNNKFYRAANESEIRTSHALDDYNLRQQIDEQLNEHYQVDENGEIVTDENGNPIVEEGYNHNTQVTINEMTSTTPELEFQVEYDDNDLTTITYSRITDRVAFKVDHIDFGIIRRPVQSVNFVKTLSKIRITLANGQVLIDASIDDEGNLQGETGGYLSYVKPKKENGITVQNGYLRAELDSELIQGATVQMEYKLRTENTSNADYTSEGFYNFSEDYYNNLSNGEQLKEQDIVTITPARVIDYLDEKSVYVQGDPTNEEYRWQQATIQDLKDMHLVASNVIQALEDGKYQYEQNGQIYEEELDMPQIFTTDYLDTTTLKPVRVENGEPQQAEGGDVYMVVEKVLNSAEDANFTNQAELALIDKPGGSKIPPTPGNYIPNENPQEEDEDISEEVIITPNTGADRNYVLPISIGIIAVVIIGVGIIIIKKKVIKNK